VSLVALGVVGVGTPFVLADTGSGSAASSADDGATSSAPPDSATPEPTASSDQQATLRAQPTKKPQRPPKKQDGKKPKKSLLDTVQEQVTEAPPVPPTTFRVSSFNVLGASHTAHSGNKPGYRSGPQRMAGALGLVRAFGVDVVGFQEFESTQFGAFNRMTGGSWGVYPGLQLGRNSVRNSIAWKRDVWTAVSTQSIAIPYFHGNRVRMPYVLLEHNATGRKVWFINVHNPASTKNHPGNERWRDVATALEASLVNRLHAQTGFPVILTGDFNERSEAFCKLTSRSPVRAANGGSTGGRCYPPRAHGIDWIFGTEDVAFSNYGFRRSGVSDHPIISSTVTVSD
jgi:endonuclease/exonuclease/phosphatase family metal-dependent hydrolase